MSKIEPVSTFTLKRSLCELLLLYKPGWELPGPEMKLALCNWSAWETEERQTTPDQ